MLHKLLFHKPAEQAFKNAVAVLKTAYKGFGLLVSPLEKNSKLVYSKNGNRTETLNFPEQEFEKLSVQKNFRDQTDDGSLVIAEDVRTSGEDKDKIRTKAIFNNYSPKGCSSMTINGWLKSTGFGHQNAQRNVQGVLRVTFENYEVLLDFKDIVIKNAGTKERPYPQIASTGTLDVYYGEPFNESVEKMYNIDQTGSRISGASQGKIDHTHQAMGYLFRTP